MASLGKVADRSLQAPKYTKDRTGSLDATYGSLKVDNPKTANETGGFGVTESYNLNQSSLLSWPTQGSTVGLPAIPGIRGWGTDTAHAYENGGRGTATPTVLYVDRLTTSSSDGSGNSGSLAWCLTRAYPRVVVPAVSGVISGSAGYQIDITEPYCYYAGQCAPGNGLYVSGNVSPISHDIVIDHLGVFNNGGGSQGADDDCFQIGKNASTTDVYNVVLANCGGLWSRDETFSVVNSGSNRSYDYTIWQCIHALPRYPATDGFGYNSLYEMTNNWNVGQDGHPGRMSALRNYYLGFRRNPKTIAGTCEISNNLLYDCKFGIEISCYDTSSFEMTQNTRSNGGVRGPDSVPDELLLYINDAGWENTLTTESFNHSGNVISSDSTAGLLDNRPGQAISSTPISGCIPEGFVLKTITDSDAGLLDFAQLMDATCGPYPANRLTEFQDPLTWCVNRLDGTGDSSPHWFSARPSNPTITETSIDHETETSHGVGTIPTTGEHVVQGSGYTLLEEWLWEHRDWAMGSSGWRV